MANFEVVYHKIMWPDQALSLAWVLVRAGKCANHFCQFPGQGHRAEEQLELVSAGAEIGRKKKRGLARAICFPTSAFPIIPVFPRISRKTNRATSPPESKPTLFSTLVSH